MSDSVIIISAGQVRQVPREPKAVADVLQEMGIDVTAARVTATTPDGDTRTDPLGVTLTDLPAGSTIRITVKAENA